MNDSSNSNLICFFSWGRPDLVERSFTNLLLNVRPQDRLLVIDQEMRNFNFYAKHRDRIDFLHFNYLNYHIGPVWMYIRNFLMWKKSLIDTYINVHKDEAKGWYPDFVNIVESDTIGKDGWIDRVVQVFNSRHPIGIASGYDDNDVKHKTIAWDGKIKIKDTCCGVNAMFRTQHFLDLFDVLHIRSQDGHASEKNRNMGKVVGILPGEVKHIGVDRQSNAELKEIHK